MSIAIKRLERAISDLPKSGMQTGSHKVKLDLADAERLIVELNALQAERDALAAQLKLTQVIIDSIHPDPNKAEGVIIKNAKGAVWLATIRLLRDVDSSKKILAAHDAEVAKAAFIEGACSFDCDHALYPEQIEERAEEYAAQLRANGGYQCAKQ